MSESKADDTLSEPAAPPETGGTESELAPLAPNSMPETRPSEDNDAPPETPTPAMRHDQAIQAYHRGQRDSALVILNEIAINPEMAGTDLQLSALVYMGEIHFIRNQDRDREVAEQIFRRVIRSNPSYVLDPFRHPPDVAAFFNAVKITMDPDELTPTVTTIGRPPIDVWSPFGIYDFRNSRPTRAWVGGSVQALCGVSSLVLAGILIDRHDWNLGGIPYPEDDEEALRQIERLQTANLLSFVGFYASWGISVTAAHRHWRTQLDVRAGHDSDQMEASIVAHLGW